MAIGIVLILAVLQGLTEFLPVSSSGHLVLAGRIFGLEDPQQGMLFVVALHVGSLLAILIYFHRDFLKLFTERRTELGYIILGSIPAAAVGFFFLDEIKSLFTSATVVAVALLFNGVFLWIAEKYAREPGDLKPWWKALGIGCAQVVGMVPGISRAGSTIGTAFLLGVRPKVAVRFSFFLGAVAIFGAALVTTKDALKSQADIPWLPIVIGVTVSLAVSLVAIRIVAILAEKRRLRWFAGYCIGVGSAALLVIHLA